LFYNIQSINSLNYTFPFNFLHNTDFDSNSLVLYIKEKRTETMWPHRFAKMLS